MKKKEIFIIFILVVLATFLSLWWFEQTARYKLMSLPYPYGRTLYPEKLQFVRLFSVLTPFVFVFWFLILIGVRQITMIIVKKVRLGKAKLELEETMNFNDSLSKKQISLIFAVSVLIVSTSSFVVPKFFKNCQERAKDVYKIFEDNQVNYCQKDTDCTIFSETNCPFPCGWLANKNADLGPIKEKMSRYFDDGCPMCERKCAMSKPENIRCLQGKCNDAAIAKDVQIKTLNGVLVGKEGTKTSQCYCAGGSDYFTLQTSGEELVLEFEPTYTEAQMSKFSGKNVAITGEKKVRKVDVECLPEQQCPLISGSVFTCEVLKVNKISEYKTIDCYDCGEGGWQKMSKNCGQQIIAKNNFRSCLMNFSWSSVNQNTGIDEIKEGYIEIGGSEVLKNPTNKSIKVFIYHQWAVDKDGNLYLLEQLG